MVEGEPSLRDRLIRMALTDPILHMCFAMQAHCGWTDEETYAQMALALSADLTSYKAWAVEYLANRGI